jgi:hypothetical protein
VNSLLKKPGYLLAVGAESHLHLHLVKRMGQAYQQFCKSWAGLARDTYLRDGGVYRYRRYSVFHWQRGRLSLLPHEPHYQSSHYNPIHGGFNRHFRAWLPASVRNPVVAEIIRWATQQFWASPADRWRIQAHQFRVLARVDEAGKPTPEGVHKDGADYILIMMMDRQNISGGVSQLYDNGLSLIAEGTLLEKGDLILLNDRAVYHGVTEVSPADPTHPAWRDVLVLTFHRA